MAATPRAIDPTFLYYHLQTVDFGKLVQEGAVPSVNQGQLQALPLAEPPHAEQRKIAAILTAVDDKLDVIARQIEATQTLKQGLMQTLFSRGAGIQSASGAWHSHEQFKDGPIGTVPQCWEFCTLGDLAVENITYGVVQPGEAVVDGVPMVRGGDIKDGEIAQNLRTISSEVSSQFKRTVLEGGELLVSLVGYPGETASYYGIEGCKHRPASRDDPYGKLGPLKIPSQLPGIASRQGRAIGRHDWLRAAGHQLEVTAGRPGADAAKSRAGPNYSGLRSYFGKAPCTLCQATQLWPP